jgi:hypothetical protein
MTKSIEQQARQVVAACLGYQTGKPGRTVTRLHDERLRSLGIDITEMNLMAAIAAQGSVQPAKLGRAMELESPPSAVTAAAWWIGGGWRCATTRTVAASSSR